MLELELEPLSLLDDPARWENAGKAITRSVTRENSTLIMFFMTLPPPIAYAIRASFYWPAHFNTSVTEGTRLIGGSILLDSTERVMVQGML
jgi:hypothetical protein